MCVCNVVSESIPSIDRGTLNGGSECFKAKARHVKEINVLLLSPALIRTLLSAENDRACTFHYVLLLVSGAPRPSQPPAFPSKKRIACGGECEFVYVHIRWCVCALEAKRRG